MRAVNPRKLTRFYVINPIGDRRLEHRFESRESVVVRLERLGKMLPAVGLDIGRYGMKIESDFDLEMGSYVQIAFPNSPDHERCFGRIVWSRPLKEAGRFEGGVSIEAWHGIVAGDESWKGHQGPRLKIDRRAKPR